jgi:hypothetical protein
LEPFLDGVDAVFLNPAAVNGDAATALIDAAVKSGVRRIVMLSSSSITDIPSDEEHVIPRMHIAIEQAIRDSGLEWTFIRGGMFATNTLQWAEQIRHGDVVRGPYAQATAALVHEKDLAALAAAGLLDRSGAHDGAVYTVTGSESLTTAEQVATVGRAIGRDLRYEGPGQARPSRCRQPTRPGYHAVAHRTRNRDRSQPLPTPIASPGTKTDHNRPPKFARGQQAKAEADLRAANEKPAAARVTRTEIAELISGIADLVVVVRQASVDDKAEIYRQLGLKLTYEPGKALVRAEATLDPDDGKSPRGSRGDLVRVRGGISTITPPIHTLTTELPLP